MTIPTRDDFELSARFKIRAMGDKLRGDHRRRILRPRGVRGEIKLMPERRDRGARRAQDRQAHPAGEVQIQGRVRRGHRIPTRTQAQPRQDRTPRLLPVGA